MRHLILTLIMTSSLAVLSGCATTTTPKQTDCASTNWQQLGIEDGKHGASSQVILRHAKACPNHAMPNRERWEQGRQEGLKSYCTTKNAYDIGRMGYTLSAVCADDDLAGLHHANMMGLQQYEMSQRISYLNRGFGYYEPFVPLSWRW